MEGFIAFIVVTGLALGTIFGLGIAYDSWDCHGYERGTGRHTRYESGTCYVEYENVWYRYSEFQKFFAADRHELDIKQSKGEN